MHKKLFVLACCVFAVSLFGCGDKKPQNDVVTTASETSAEESVTAAEDNAKSGTSVSSSMSGNSVSSVEDEKDLEAFKVFDGYYTFEDDNNNAGYLLIKDGILTIETLGDKPDGTTSEMYIENDNVYAKFLGKKCKFIYRDEWAVELYEEEEGIVRMFDYPTNLFTTLNCVPEAYAIESIALVKNISKAEDEALRAEEEHEKRITELEKEAEEKAIKEEEERKAAAKEAEEKKKAEEEKKKAEREEKLSEYRSSQGWFKGKVVSFAATQGWYLVQIEISETNYPGLGAGSVIELSGTDGACNCYDDVAFLFNNPSYIDNKLMFEGLIDKHACGSGYYVLSKFLG